MKLKTNEITAGAMFTAIFAIMLLIDRQTGTAFQDMIMFFLPIPMVGYASRYGLKPGLAAWGAMSLISIIVSTPTGIFYAVEESAIGLLLGVSVYKKRDMTKTLLEVMGLSALANVLNTIFLASLFGYNLTAEIAEMKDMMLEVFQKANATTEMVTNLTSLLTPQYLLQLMIISMIITGLLQGFVVYEISLLVLRRLKFVVPRPASLFTYYPPIWTAGVAFGFSIAYTYSQQATLSALAKNVCQMLGTCGYLYLVCFGFIAVMLLVKTRIARRGPLAVIIAFLLFIIAPMLEMILGVIYIIPSYHDRMMGKYNK